MAQKARIKINSQGARAILSGAEVRADIEARTARVARAAGDGFESSVEVVGGSNKLGRVMGRVRTANAKGRVRQARSNVLQKSLGAGGG